MKYSELEEKHIFAANRLFEYLGDSIWFSLSEENLKRNLDIPYDIAVKHQIISNLEKCDTPNKYFEILKNKFENTKFIITQIKEAKYKFSDLRKELEMHIDNDKFKNSHVTVGHIKDEIKSLDRGIDNAQRIMQLAETIQETIANAEQTIEQPPTVEVVEENEEQTIDETNTELRIQMLIVHYLKMLGYLKTNFHDNTKVASLFSLLLGRHEQNIRTHLSYPNPDFIDNDLRTLLPVFESLGEQAKPVIDNIKKNLERVENEPNNKPNRKKSLQS